MVASSVYSVSSEDCLFFAEVNQRKRKLSTDDTDGHGGPQAEQRLYCSDYLTADVRQMLYGFSSVSDLFIGGGYKLA